MNRGEGLVKRGPAGAEGGLEEAEGGPGGRQAGVGVG